MVSPCRVLHNSSCMEKVDRLALIRDFSQAHGISGFEGEVRALFSERLSGCGEFSCDRLGSVFCEKGKGATVMLAAHLDEVGFMVQQITVDGFIKFVGIGGWWGHTLLSQRVVIKTRSGRKIVGVIGSKPPHFLAEAQRNSVMALDAMFIDVGAENYEQVTSEMGIALGDPIAPDSDFMSTGHACRFMGKAFDDRLGLAALIEVGLSLRNTDSLPHKLVLAGTCQEEVGIRGAKTVGIKCSPDCAIILEAPPADDTPGFSLNESQGSLGKGVQIRLFDPTAIMNSTLVQWVESVAQKANIPYQMTVRRSGGTDAGALHLIQEGVPCIVLGVPTRSIHAHTGVMDIRDYEAMVALLKALLPSLTAEKIASFTRYI